MSLTLANLLDKTHAHTIKVIAGEEYLSNPVSWAHFSESAEAATFLFRNEIAFITGIGLSEDFGLIDLMKEIYKAGPSGILVNTGKYISKIDEECIDFCNEHKLPLLTVPWNVHLSLIMKDFCFLITKAEQRNTTLASAFKNAIHFPNQEELFIITLSQYGFNSVYSYSATVIKYKAGKKAGLDIDTVTEKIQNYMAFIFPNALAFSFEDNIVVIMGNLGSDTLRDIAYKLKKKTQEIVGKSTFYMGVGRLTKSIRCIYKSYKQAKQIIAVSEKRKNNDYFIYYDMGLYRLLIGIEDNEIIKDFLDHTLLPLKKYDDENSSTLMEFLYSFLSHNGSVKETSEELYIHRNTAIYKIHKIEEIIGMDLSLLEIRTQLILAYALFEMY